MILNKKVADVFFKRMGYDVEVTGKGRETIDAMRHRFTKIKKQCQKIGGFNEADETHIVTICMAEEIQMRAFMDIIEHGTIMFVDTAKSIKQKNHSVSTFYQCSRMILECSARLGMSVADRQNLKIESEKEDGFGEQQ